MKKLVVLLILVLTVGMFAAFSACGNGQELQCYVPGGAPALAVANIIDAKKVGAYSVQTTVTTGENVNAKCQNLEADLAILPTNLAVKICSVRTEYCFFSVNIHGLLYLVGTREIQSLAELQGEEVYSIGQGNTPEFVFKKILDAQNVDYTSSDGINFHYVADASAVIPLFMQGSVQFAVLGEPAVSTLIALAQSKNKTVHCLADLQQLWQQATSAQSAGYPQAGLIVKKSLLADSAFATALTEKIFANETFLAENVGRLNELMTGAGSNLDTHYTLELLNRCNISAVFAGAIRQDIETYLSTFPAMQQHLPLDGSLFYEQTH